MRLFTLLVALGFGFIATAQMPATLSKEEKLLGLSNFWKEVEYNFVYWDQVDRERWNSDYQKLLSEVQQTENNYEYFRLLQKYCASLHDGHTNIYLPASVNAQLFNSHFGEYILSPFLLEDKIIVHRINKAKAKEIPVGTEIVRINGLPAIAYMEKEVMPYISASTDHFQREYASWHLFQSPVGTSYQLELKRPDGSPLSLTLTHQASKQQQMIPPYINYPLFEFKWMKDSIAYIYLHSFSNKAIVEEFEAALPQISKAKRLIIDIRNNSGGSTSVGRDILKHLTKDSILYGIKAHSRLHIPAYKAWGDGLTTQDTIGDKDAAELYLAYQGTLPKVFKYSGDTLGPGSAQITVPTLILTGPNTCSAAEDFLVYTENQSHIKIMGEPSNGSTGQPLYIDLPGGGYGRVCTKKDTYPDGRMFVGVGVQPHIYVRQTIVDWIKGKDTLLEYAIKYLQN